MNTKRLNSVRQPAYGLPLSIKLMHVQLVDGEDRVKGSKDGKAVIVNFQVKVFLTHALACTDINLPKLKKLDK